MHEIIPENINIDDRKLWKHYYKDSKKIEAKAVCIPAQCQSKPFQDMSPIISVCYSRSPPVLCVVRVDQFVVFCVVFYFEQLAIALSVIRLAIALSVIRLTFSD
jgi:hypothetical protein